VSSIGRPRVPRDVYPIGREVGKEMDGFCEGEAKGKNGSSLP